MHLKPNNNTTLFAIAVFLLLAGAVCGSIYSVYINPSQCDSLKQYINNCMEAKNIVRVDLFKAEALNHFKIVMCAIVCAQSLYLFGVFVAMFAMRGFAFGFSVAFVAKNYSSASACVLVLSSVLSCIVTLPCYVFLFIIALKYAIRRHQSRYIIPVAQKRKNFFKFAAIAVMLYSILCIGSIIEALITPLFNYLI